MKGEAEKQCGVGKKGVSGGFPGAWLEQRGRSRYEGGGL